MFMSEYSHSIDSKGRMILPAKFREELGDHFVLAPGLDSCLCIYTMEHWNNLISKFEQMSATHQNVRKVKRYLIGIGSAVEVHYAKHGSYPAAIGDLVNATGKDGFLKSEPKPPIDGEAYSLNAATGEVTYVFKGTTYSSFGKNTKKG